ncbi:hypothetical protein CHU98_g6360 [Xylaria longipes]|nr:hypothetical protein CHU98_g6360 [Xylaria longipes]
MDNVSDEVTKEEHEEGSSSQQGLEREELERGRGAYAVFGDGLTCVEAVDSGQVVRYGAVLPWGVIGRERNSGRQWTEPGQWPLLVPPLLGLQLVQVDDVLTLHLGSVTWARRADLAAADTPRLAKTRGRVTSLNTTTRCESQVPVAYYLGL